MVEVDEDQQEGKDQYHQDQVCDGWKIQECQEGQNEVFERLKGVGEEKMNDQVNENQCQKGGKGQKSYGVWEQKGQQQGLQVKGGEWQMFERKGGLKQELQKKKREWKSEKKQQSYLLELVELQETMGVAVKGEKNRRKYPVCLCPRKGDQ